MKQASYYVIVFLLIVGLSSCQEKSTEAILLKSLAKIEKTEDILLKSLAKIENIKTVEQILVTEHYDLGNYFFKIDTSAYYFDFKNVGKTSGSRYQCPGTYLSTERPISNYAYDNAKMVEGPYGRKSYIGSAKFYFPIFGTIDAVKRFLPNLLSDSTIQITRLNDTTVNGNRKHYHIHCLLLNKNIQPGGELHEASYAEDHMQFSYDLFIDKENGLPTEIVHKYRYLDKTIEGWKATTLRYNFSPQRPDSVWNLTSNPLNYIAYSGEDITENRKERLRVQMNNLEAPRWELPDLSGNIHSLDEFRDKLLLLEFWYIGCGGCHRSIPFLNKVKRQYDPDKFDVAGINFVISEKNQLKKYVKDSGIDFLVLDNGAQTAIKYKVSGAPLILLIKNGTIVHAVEGYNDVVKAELTEMIEKYI